MEARRLVENSFEPETLRTIFQSFDGSNRPRNALLELLPARDFALVEPLLEPVELSFRKQLQCANRKMDKVYFPETGLASVVARGNGKEAEVGIVGNEGMVGIPLVLGTDRSPSEIFIQAEGAGHALPAPTFCDLLQRSAALLRICLLYAHVYNVQAHYTALANAKGKLEERLARWLLMAQDRLRTPELKLTHEFLALMLGVRRAGVSTAVEGFEAQGLVSTARGVIGLLDRDGLIRIADGLYGASEAEYERVLGKTIGS